MSRFRDRFLILIAGFEAVFDLMTGHRAITGVIVRLEIFHLADYWPADFHGGGMEFRFHGIGAVMTGTALDQINLGIRNQL